MKNWLLLLVLISFASFSQNKLIIGHNSDVLGNSVTERFSYYKVENGTVSPQAFLAKKSQFKSVRITSKIVNLDFSTSSYFIHFTLKNESGKDQSLVLETARPFTNVVSLYCVETKEIVISGDAMPFASKNLPTNFSALSLFVPSGKSREYVLKLCTEGENMGFSMVFYDQSDYMALDSNRHLFIGIILGIFIFVIIIYSMFFVMLKERLFLVYVLYATCSVLLQVSVDGYMHQFVFTSGGYFTQHCTIILAGGTVILGMLYATGYLALTGTMKKIGFVINALVLVAMVLSLIPQIRFQIAFSLINGFSLLGLIFMLTTGFIQQRKQTVSSLFLIGLAFLVLGGFVFVLGNLGVIESPIITQNALKVGTLLELIFLAVLMAGRYKILQEEREKAQAALLIELEEKNNIVRAANVRLEEQVAERTKEIEAQRELLKEKNEDFMASVTYAERIQSAVLSNEEKFRNILPNSFVFFQPKDVVSGDFYWIDQLVTDESTSESFLGYVTADCTGHGVPGALVSLIGNHLLERGKETNGLRNTGRALDELSSGMNAALNSQYTSKQIRDGMDLTLCVLDQKRRKLYFSGARNSAYIVRNGEVIELKGDRKSIGFDPKEESHVFLSQEFDLEIGDMIYTSSDGYADQFGGESGKKFMSRQLKALCVELSLLPLDVQKAKFSETLKNWMGEHEQLDDVLLIGVRII